MLSPMAMGVKTEIISSELIKPSSPTPDHLKTHNLTILDQTAPASYVPLCLFYPYSPTASYDTTKSSHQRSFADSLKHSLSDTLNTYYPLAGRYKDAFSVECNDAGADFLQARVAGRMSDALQHPDEDRLLPLLPCRPRGRHVDAEGRLVLLAVLVSFFQCGGVSIGVCMWHGLADACTLACFLKTWSETKLADGGGSGKNGVVVRDCTDMLPPCRDLSAVGECMDRFRAAVATPGTRIKRFVFGGDKVAALRREIEAASSCRPSRVVAVSAVIWAAAIKIARDKKKRRNGERDHDGDDGRYHVATMATNLRSRMNPVLEERVMGNVVQFPVFAEWPVNDDDMEEEDNNYGALAEKLRESVKMVSDETVREAAVGSGFVEVFRYFVEEYGGGNLLAISSWCRFPFYEMDFGLGKPSWMCFFTMCYSLVVLMDTKDGEGIEAWVTLSGEDMLKFENDVGVLRYATCSKSSVAGLSY